MRLECLEDRTLLSTSIPLNSVSWTPIGPAGVSGTSGFGGGNGGPASGRINGIAADPANPNTIYVAATGGGVWKTTNGGTSWTPLTDNQITTMMGSIAIAPSDPNVIYAGTGQADNSGDSYYGRGILKSTDGGNTWTLVGNSNFNRKAVMKIVINPTDSRTAYAAVSTPDNNGLAGGNGIWKTTDGGNTWTNTTTSITTNNDFTDVVMDNTNPLILYAAVGSGGGSANNGVYKTIDGGLTWAIAGNFPKGNANGRISLAIANSMTSEVAASVSDPATDGLKYLLLTTDSGATWTNLTAVPSYLGGQGSYDNTVAISPTNPNIIIAAGVTNYSASPPFNMVVESRDGGNTWSDITVDGTGGEPHTDEHASTFDASGRYLVGGDGGIWRLNNAVPATLKWQDINSNLQTIQFVGTALDPTNGDIVYGGSQDNGTEKFNDNKSWKQVFGGDGGYVAVDSSNTQTVYNENFGISLHRSDDGGVTWQNVTTGIGNDPSNFYVPYTIDPSNPSHLLYGTNRIYTSTNRGNSWSALFTPGSNGWNSTVPVRWISISPADPKTIYATTDDAKIFVSTDGGSNWVEHDVPTAHDAISMVIASPNDPKTAFATRDAFNGGANTGHLFETTDGGSTWKDISGNLPNIPSQSFADDVRPGNSRLYVGTDEGVYFSKDGGNTWAVFKTGLPNVIVTNLELNTNLNILEAGTYGRGVFEIRATESIGVLPDALNATEGVALSNVQVAHFNDSSGLLPTSAYTATIDWGDGTGTTTVSGSGIVDLGSGFYGIDASHTYSDEGAFKMSISVTSTAGSSGTATSSTSVGDAPLSAVPTAFTPTEGTKFSGAVGSFLDGNATAPVSDFTATIDWGDGKVTSGTVTALGGGVYSVSGTNTYKDAGSYPVSISVTDVGGSRTTVSSTGSVQDAPLVGTAKSFTSVAGTTFTATVASFVDPAPGDVLTDYGVTVTWGDGTTSDLTSGVSVINRGTRYDIVASHTYHKFGTYSPVAVTITDEGGASTTVNSTATIADAPLTATATNFSTTEGQAFTGQVASFTSSNVFASASDFLPTTIDWGDGSTPSPATIVALGGGKFGVQGTHTYTEEGLPNTVTVVITSAGGKTATSIGQATVVDAPIAASGVSLSGVAGAIISGTVATFVDAYALSTAAEFTASIDWGDGTVTAGVITQPGGQGTPYVVSGSHAYAQALTYAISVSISEPGGAADTANSTATMADAPITAQAGTIPSLFEGNAFQGTVGSFTSANPLAIASDFLASIDWGDGGSSGGVLTAIGNGTFNVSNMTPHVYAEEGNYTATLTVVSLGGHRASATIPVSVEDGLIAGAPGNAIQTVAGQTFSGVVGSFTEYALAPLSDFTAKIDWYGDGTNVTPGVVAVGPNGTFTVSGTNTFTQAGSFSTKITVDDVGGSIGTFTLGANVADAALTSASVPISAVKGVAFTGKVATFTSANPFAQASEFSATIDWGDGSAPSPGVIAGSIGSFTVSGAHVFALASPGLSVTVTIVHNVPGGNTTSTTDTAHVLVPISGAMSPASDSGVSSHDGITNDNHPVFLGKAEPGSVVRIYAAPAGTPLARTQVGIGAADASGNWTITINPLADGVYVMFATMFDPSNGNSVQTTPLPVSTSGGPLIVATTGPTVTSVALNAPAGTLSVLLQGGLAGFNPAGIANTGNYVLALPVGLGLQTFTARGLAVTGHAGGSLTVTLSYNLGGARFAAGGYVVMIHAKGITDLAGNMLVEKHFLTFPQTTNSPNPDYVAQIDVSKTGAASAPHQYISLAEQIAAGLYSNTTQKKKIIRVPPVSSAAVVTNNTTGVPTVSSFSKKK
jgi:photosystem II stability/assembly factor-like uncharacterized protein